MTIMPGFEPLPGSPLMLGFYTPGFWEITVILVIGLLLFGRRLPEVGRGLGRTIVEFKKGLRDVKDEIDIDSSKDVGESPRLSARSDAAARAGAASDEARVERS